MINVGKWRWPVILGLPFLAGLALFFTGVVRPNYEGQATLEFSGSDLQIDKELEMLRFHPAEPVTMEKVPGHPLQIFIRGQAHSPSDVISKLQSAAQSSVDRSLARQKKDLGMARDADQKQVTDLDVQMDRLMQQQKTILAGPARNTPRAQLVAKIAELKTRRSLLIENYPTHTDIPVLAKKIQELVKQLAKPTGRAAGKISDLDRQINEAKVRRDYYVRRLKDTEKELSSLKPIWKIILPIEKPRWPREVQQWPLGAGVVAGVFVLGLILFKTGEQPHRKPVADGLWRPEAVETPLPEKPVALEVVHTELPSDPLTEKARTLYGKWVELSKLLYTPAPEPPQGVLDQVAPLLQESSDFLPEGHDVLARYLARSVTPGDLASHVARTVLMTLTGAQEAGVSPEHRLAMALAALFHDLAVVPRPVPAQDEVGSEVGRLSAAVLPRIPGLPVALLAMVEDILIGMDEFKLETWQNVANGKNLEPLSKVLREIDRFEKVMQKQRARLDRRAPTAREASQ